MAPTATLDTSTAVVVVDDKGGVTLVDPRSPLRRLNYFDGKLLRASDLNIEQEYQRRLVAISNQGLGPGVVYGYSATLGGGDTLEIGPGLAIDPAGKVLLLQAGVSQNIQALIDASRRLAPAASGTATTNTGNGLFNDCIEIAAPPPTTTVPVSDVYAIVICSAEALCGQADVYGKLCEAACVTSTDRPFRLDGVVLRAIPLQLVTPFPTSKVVPIGGNAYLRSKVAHSWFADEARKHPDSISRLGLLSDIWCLGSSYDSSCCEVPLAVIARAGTSTIFLDPWIVRRERMDAPARRYWQWNMRMRPWDVFLAQILQFQCQLADALGGVTTPGGRDVDPCAPHFGALREASDFIASVKSGLAAAREGVAPAPATDRPALLSLSLTHVANLDEKIKQLLLIPRRPTPTDRILIRNYILEMSPAGYLPIYNGSDVTVNDQVRALLGEGLDLRFCITTADYIAHAIEEAQHMDRISLIQGIDDPTNKPHVDILVPDGVLATTTVRATGLYDATLTFSSEQTGGMAYRGAAREEASQSGATTLSVAAAGLSQSSLSKLQVLARAMANPKAEAGATTVRPNLDTNVFINAPKTAGAELDAVIANAASAARLFSLGNVSAAARKRVLASESRLVTTKGAVDGMWLTAATSREWRSLGVDDHTPVDLRVVIGSRPASPLALDLTFHGTFAVKSVASGPVLTGTLNGIVAIGIVTESQAEQKTTEYLLTERVNWPATVTYGGDVVNGTIALDVRIGGSTEAGGSPGTHLRFLRIAGGTAAPITYQLEIITGAAVAPETFTLLAVAPSSTAFLLGRLRLVPDADVINQSNAFHQSAENGLEIVQAALLVSEPDLKTKAEAVLFPPPAPTKELSITAVRDWVAFTRRREKRCEVIEAPPPPVPPRTYRVIDVRANTLEEANRLRDTLSARLQDPATIVQTIQSLVMQEDKLQHVKLYVRFAGDRATALSDLAAAESDWKTFSPGKTIVYAAVGAAGETDATLQLKRLATFESAVNADSHETAQTKDEAIVPYPQAAAPPDADGVMVIVTAAEALTRHALLIYGNWDRPNHFLSNDPPGPSTTVDFSDNAPQGDALLKYVKSLTPNQPVNGVTLSTTKAAPDAGAAQRVQAVVDALVAVGRPAPKASRRGVEALNDHDRAELVRVGQDPTKFDEVIFFELNSGD
jgi:hypothetical protein